MMPASTPHRKRRDGAKQDGRGVEIQRLIGRSLRSICSFEGMGEYTVYIDCDVLNADGGTRTASISGAFIAAALCVDKAVKKGLLAKFPLTKHVAAVSAGIVEDTPLLDLCYTEDSGAQALVFSPEYGDTVENIRGGLPGVKYYIDMHAGEDGKGTHGFRKLIREAEACGYEQREIDENAMSALLYTSGTTGKSKGVMLTQKNILSASEGGLSLLDLGQVCMSVLPVHHSFESTHGITMMIQNGTTICVNDSLRHFMQNLQLFKPDTLCLVPLFVEMMHRKIWQNAERDGQADALRGLLRKSNEELRRGEDNRGKYFKNIHDAFGGNLKLIICGGAPLSARLMREFREFGILLLNGYGITECAPLVSVNKNRYYCDGAVGIPIACCDVKVENADEDGDGEIWVKGPNVMLGYYKNEEGTKEVMKDGWFNTGDIGRINGGGFLHITGRKKNLIVLSNGKNIYPEEIEEYLMRIPYIKEVVVYAPLTDGLNETELCAEIFVAEEYSAGRSAREIEENLEKDISAVNKTLPTYKHIGRFHVRGREFEKTTKKSIKRFAM
ncbi:MAG: 2-succinylbenzoate--CoA ligase [Desulfovibrio sp.]